MRNVPYEPTLDGFYCLIGPYEDRIQIRLKPMEGAGDFPMLPLRSGPLGSRPLATIYHVRDHDQDSCIQWSDSYRWTADQLVSGRPCCIRADLIYDTLKQLMIQRVEYRTFENWKAVAHEYHRVCIEEGVPIETAVAGFDAIMSEWDALSNT